MIHKPIDEIEKEDIDRLIDDQVQENKRLEYKLELPGSSDKAKKEFLADVSSFANATGGDLVFGISDKRENRKATGVPEEAVGLEGIAYDNERRRLEDIIRNNLEPRVPNIQFKEVPGFPNGSVIVLRIPSSWQSPHMITFQTSSHFYSRTSAGKYPLDVTEIRSAFLMAESLGERIRRFRDDRISRIISGQTPVELQQGPLIVLHVLPISAFEPGRSIDLATSDEKALAVRGICIGGGDGRYNFDGFVNWDGNGREYAQLFRTGSIESVTTHLMLEAEKEGKIIAGKVYEKKLIMALKDYLATMKKFEVALPIFCFLTFLGVKGYSMPTQGLLDHRQDEIEKENLFLPEIIIQEFEVDAASILKPAFDTVWQACGQKRSLNYHASTGEWRW